MVLTQFIFQVDYFLMGGVCLCKASFLHSLFFFYFGLFILQNITSKYERKCSPCPPFLYRINIKYIILEIHVVPKFFAQDKALKFQSGLAGERSPLTG